MTLVEVMIGLGIFSIVAASTIAAMMQSRRLTEASLRQNTAQVTAHGYLEQLKGLPFNQLTTSDVPEPTVPKVKVRFGNGDDADDELILSRLPRSKATEVPNVRLLDVNNTPNDPSDDSRVTFAVYVERVNESVNSSGPARLISISYTWLEPTVSGWRQRSDIISCIRSDIR